MAVFLVDMGLGLFEIFSTKTSPLPRAFILLIFAVVFITAMVFYERRGVDPFGSLLGGALAGFGFSFVIVFLVGGVQFAFSGGISALGWEQVISAVAGCMVLSMIIIKMLSSKLEDRFY